MLAPGASCSPVSISSQLSHISTKLMDVVSFQSLSDCSSVSGSMPLYSTISILSPSIRSP